MRKPRISPELLQAALVGLAHQRAKIEAKIVELRRMIGDHVPASASAAAPKKRVLSAAARKRIAAGQKKRWAQYRKARKPAKR